MIENSNVFAMTVKRDLRSIICPSCLMFGEHKMHSVSPLQESFDKMQLKITHDILTGTLSQKEINYNIFEIKHAVFLCTEEKEKLKTEIHLAFEKIRKAISEREQGLIIQLDEINSANIEKLSRVECKWTEKYQIALEILYVLKLLEEKKINVYDVMVNAKDIYHKLAVLEEKIECDEIKCPSGVEFKLKVNQLNEESDMTNENLVDNLKRYGFLRDFKTICFKL